MAIQEALCWKIARTEVRWYPTTGGRWPMAPSPSEASSWIRCFHPAPDSSVRLVCFPHAGGAASYYLPLSLALTPDVEVLAIQYPGRQDRRTERVIDDIHRLADRLYPAHSAWTDRPYAFFGHSMGAILAYEVARRLAERAGSGPVQLFASGRRAPSCQREESVHLRDDAGLISELRRLGGTDQRFLDDEELLSMILPITRADYRAIETYSYRPGPPLACPITALTGDADPNNSIDDVSAWRAHSTGPFELKVFAGGHFFLDAHRTEVVQTVSGALAGLSRIGSLDGGAR
jgi:surfactin synthase thioesterase subunit